ncbi:MAG TPA: glycosyltransferase N-terminal domain-containing protein, partial [Pirellulales bacterium]
PDLLLLAELEVWPNLIEAAHQAGAKVAVFNGRLSEKSFRGWRRLLSAGRAIFSQLDFVAAQNEEYAQRFRALGVSAEAIVTPGNVKFDGCPSDRRAPAVERLRTMAAIQADDFVFIAGSTQAPEEEHALDVFERLSVDRPRMRLVIVPRHPERFDEVARMLEARRVVFERRSRLDQPSPNPTARVLLVDTVGELSAWWGLADAAFVGGSFGRRGGQNMLEPAGYGAAVCFGPNTWNFRVVVEQLLAREAAVVVASPTELEAFVARVHDEPYSAAQLGRRAAALVREGQGAAKRTVDALCERFPELAGPATLERKAG